MLACQSMLTYTHFRLATCALKNLTIAPGAKCTTQNMFCFHNVKFYTTGKTENKILKETARKKNCSKLATTTVDLVLSFSGLHPSSRLTKRQSKDSFCKPVSFAQSEKTWLFEGISMQKLIPIKRGRL